MIPVLPHLVLDERTIEIRFVRSPGPGGQHVNKTSTCAVLRFDVNRADTLPESVRQRLKALAGRRLGADGMITLRASRFRSAERNRADAVERLVELVKQAAHRAPRRRPTRPSKAAKERRLSGKKQRATTKQNRRRPVDD